MIVKRLEDLTETEVHAWRALYRRRGRGIQHSPDYAQALTTAGMQVVVAMGEDIVALATIGRDTATICSTDSPVVAAHGVERSQLGPAIQSLRSTTGLSVYIPLVDARYRWVSRLGAFSTWDRSPNSTVDWSTEGQDLMERVADRGGSQLLRKRRSVERAGLTLDFDRAGVESAREMLTVDDRSWKADTGQSMRQRGQASMYTSLLVAEVVHVTFLRDGARPVAFQVYARLGDRLTCLKASYDLAYSKFSPGFYLMTTGLVEQWANQGIRVVDLFGGPDRMKEFIYSRRHPRIDIWFGDPKRREELQQERQAHDARVSTVVALGKGLRHVFD